MSEHFINLNCANCGAKLDVYDDMERFACGYCGTELIVQRRGGTVALKAVTEAIKQVQVGTDKTAAELALVRLKQERAETQSRITSLGVVNPPQMPMSVGTAKAILIGGAVTGIVFGVLGGAEGVGAGLVIAILICLIPISARGQVVRYEAWQISKAKMETEIAGIEQEIARQMEIVSGSGFGTQSSINAAVIPDRVKSDSARQQGERQEGME